MDLTQLWQVWSIAGPWHLTPLSGGTNNLVWRAETSDGENYVLRLFPELSQLPRLRYEAALLLALSDLELPMQQRVEHSLWREAWLIAHIATSSSMPPFPHIAPELTIIQ
jgi:Phosphotransferase enzyme family